MILNALVMIGVMFLFWMGLARIGSSKEEWKKEKSQNIEFAFAGAIFVVVMALLVALTG
jgi:arginine exporter protein ArgO